MLWLISKKSGEAAVRQWLMVWTVCWDRSGKSDKWLTSAISWVCPSSPWIIILVPLSLRAPQTENWTYAVATTLSDYTWGHSWTLERGVSCDSLVRCPPSRSDDLRRHRHRLSVSQDLLEILLCINQLLAGIVADPFLAVVDLCEQIIAPYVPTTIENATLVSGSTFNHSVFLSILNTNLIN